jgi:hypothetical protein
MNQIPTDKSSPHDMNKEFPFIPIYRIHALCYKAKILIKVLNYYLYIW